MIMYCTYKQPGSVVLNHVVSLFIVPASKDSCIHFPLAQGLLEAGGLFSVTVFARRH